jgi:hypothetical protein
MYKNVLNLFGNMLTAGLPHIAAPLDSRKLPCALFDSRTLPRALPHTATLPDIAVLLPYTAAHYMNSNATHRTLHTAHHTQLHATINNGFKQMHVNAYEFS